MKDGSAPQSGSYPTGRLLVFAKAPVPGRVKTRLMPRLDAIACARLQRWLILRTLKTATDAALCPIELWCAPDCSHPFFRECARRFQVETRAQQGDHLGVRMHFALSTTLAHAEFALIIGCDCPALDSQYLAEAIKGLTDDVPVILGPAEDGGYVLIGVRCTTLIGARHTPLELFEGIKWGTSAVLDQTRERLRSLGWRWRELAPQWDLDRPGDLVRFAAEGLNAPSALIP